MSASPHHLLLASAGTGKTWRLTGRFLELCFAGVEPARILATTFTRKSAGEIQARVLERLALAAEDPAERAALGRELARPNLSAAECTQLLARLARGLHQLQVRTLDSFFAHLARLFALDLALPPEWRIADEREDAELRAEAIARVLESAPQAERLELLRALQRESGARSVHEALLAIVREFRAAGLDCARAAWEVVAPCGALEAEELAAALQALEALAVPLTQKGAPFVNWQRCKEEALRCTGAGDWEGYLELGLVKKVIEGAASFDKKPISDELRALLLGLARHATSELVRRIRAQNSATRDFLARFEAAFGALQREHGAYRFEDVPPLLLGGGLQGGGLEERGLDLWYRLDGRIDHLLLDEFQDTAPLQWRILAPIADEILAEGIGARSFFCVGDVKQSIYGWRSAEPRLLAGFAARYPVLQPETLAKSYRSAPVVLDTVNRVFLALEESAALAGEESEALRAAAAGWRAGFPEHVAAKKELPGAALLLEAEPAAEGEKKELPVLRAAVERVVALASEAPEASIGVLLRRNKHIPWLLECLLRRGLRASGEGGNPLTDSEAVLAFLSLLHLADHPGDSAAAFHVASSPFGGHFDLAQDALPERAAELSRALRRRLARDGYGELAASLLPIVERARSRWSDWDRLRYLRLVDLAHAFDARATLRPVDFAEHVRRERIDEPAAARVRVMTVHASKGLEFDAVVLPELDLPLWRGREALFTRRSDPYGPLDALTVAAKKALCALDPTLGALREDARRRGIEEALSLLYVAMTRAARRLEMIVQYRALGKESGAVTHAALLRAALASGVAPEERVLWRHPDSVDAWAAGLGTPQPAPEPAMPRPAPIVLALEQRPRARRERSASAEELQKAGARELLRPRPSAATRRGSLAHRWLEELEWIETFARTDEELLALGIDIEPDAELRRAALAELRAALAQPAVRAALSLAGRERAGIELEVQRERRFAVYLPNDEGLQELWTGSIDRLVLERERGALVAAELLDYKTDRMLLEAVEARADFYRPQIDAYRRIAALITGLDASAIHARLLFLHPGRLWTPRGASEPL